MLINPFRLKGDLEALLLVTVSAKNSFIDAHYPGVVPPAFLNELGYFISIIQQLLLVQTSDDHESEQFGAVIHVIYQCYQTLEGVSSRLSRAGNGELDDNRRSSLLRCYIKEQLQDEIEGLRDMIFKNIQAVNAMFSIRNSTRSSSMEIAGTGRDSTQPRRRSSSFGSFKPDDPEKTLLPKAPEERPRPAFKTVRFNPLPEVDQPPPVYPRHGPLGLSDAATHIGRIVNHLDLESQAPMQKRAQGMPQHFISLMNFGLFLIVSFVFLLYYIIKKHDVSTGIGIMGALLSLSTMVDQVLQWLHRRRGVRCEECLKI